MALERAGHARAQGTRTPWSGLQVHLPEVWVRLSTVMTMHYIFFLSFNGVVISLLCESLMLLWLNTAQLVAQWFGVVSKRVVCENALASPNRNACLLSTDCITCKTTGGQNAHLTDFKTIVTIGGEEMSSQSEPGLVDKHPHFQAWGLLVVNSGCSCCQSKSGYCGNLYSYPWYPCLG